MTDTEIAGAAERPGGKTVSDPTPGLKLAFRYQIVWPPRGRAGRRVRARSHLLTLDFAEVGGRLECVRLELGPLPNGPNGPSAVPVTASALRSIPVGELIDRALFEQTKSLRRWAKEAGPADPRARYLQDRVAAAEASLERGPGRPPLYKEGHFMAVADSYTRAWRIGKPPREAVANRWRVSLSTAAKWVARARAMGYLPPTERGEALGAEGGGERPPTRPSGPHRTRRLNEIERIEEREDFELKVLSEHEAWLAKLTGPASTGASKRVARRKVTRKRPSRGSAGVPQEKKSRQAKQGSSRSRSM